MVSKNSTWHILFNPTNANISDDINILDIFQDLFSLGEYKLEYQSNNNDSESFWSIFLVTNKGLKLIEDALKTINDYCKIFKIADFDIFNSNIIEVRKEIAAKEKSIIDFTMNQNKEK